MKELGLFSAVLIAWITGFLTALGLVLLILFFAGKGNLSLQYANVLITIAPWKP